MLRNGTMLVKLILYRRGTESCAVVRQRLAVGETPGAREVLAQGPHGPVRGRGDTAADPPTWPAPSSGARRAPATGVHRRRGRRPLPRPGRRPVARARR